MKFVSQEQESEPTPKKEDLKDACVMAPVDLKDLTPEAIAKVAIQAHQLIDECFAAIQRQGFWMSKDFQISKIWDLDRDRVWNILNLWRRIYQAKAKETIAFYISGPEPNGDGAQMAYEHEQEWWFENGAEDGWKVLVQKEPAYTAIMSRAKYLKLPIESWTEY